MRVSIGRAVEFVTFYGLPTCTDGNWGHTCPDVAVSSDTNISTCGKCLPFRGIQNLKPHLSFYSSLITNVLYCIIFILSTSLLPFSGTRLRISIHDIVCIVYIFSGGSITTRSKRKESFWYDHYIYAFKTAFPKLWTPAQTCSDLDPTCASSDSCIRVSQLSDGWTALCLSFRYELKKELRGKLKIRRNLRVLSVLGNSFTFIYIRGNLTTDRTLKQFLLI
jgi:hypothetical protein